MRGNNIKEKSSNRLSNNKQGQLNQRKEGDADVAGEDGNAANGDMVHSRESCLPVRFLFFGKKKKLA